MNNMAIKIDMMSLSSFEAFVIEQEKKSLFRKKCDANSLNEATSGEISEPITSQELLSLHAVLAHLALARNKSEKSLEAIVEAEFSVEHLAEISKKDYQSVMTFLMDLHMEDIRSQK